ncbi:aldo/keto reductase [Phlyctema vagabunda]|uniref:Aldo/keto reductase n=1 Tax=Phlyctema vagabunda TaxID=108571 RepID=A0ABR4P5T2_9HELO
MARIITHYLRAATNNNPVKRLSIKRKMATLSTAMELKGSETPRPSKMPRLVYGTAWKKKRSSDLVFEALRQGFRGIDTAAQPRHYQEKLVGDGIRRAIAEGIVTRDELYIQTKYTPLSGQDHDDMPYSVTHTVEESVHASVASSLSNLKTSSDEDSYLDCLVLHSPTPTIEDTYLVWSTLESYVPHKIRALGISNTTLSILSSLTESMKIPPSVCQNRFYHTTKYELCLRQFCEQEDIIYQSFWTLSGNPALLKSAVIASLAELVGVDKEVALYAMVLGLGKICILDGTTNPDHMEHDLKGVKLVESWAQGEGRSGYEETLKEFKALISEVD